MKVSKSERTNKMQERGMGIENRGRIASGIGPIKYVTRGKAAGAITCQGWENVLAVKRVVKKRMKCKCSKGAGINDHVLLDAMVRHPWIPLCHHMTTLILLTSRYFRRMLLSSYTELLVFSACVCVD